MLLAASETTVVSSKNGCWLCQFSGFHYGVTEISVEQGDMYDNVISHKQPTPALYKILKVGGTK